MRFASKLFMLAAVYAVFLILGVWSLCAASVFKCELVDAVTWAELLPPVIFIVTGIFVLGICVAYITLYILRLILKNGEGFPVFYKILVVGVLSGIFPRFLWEVTTGGFPENFYPHMDYLPFLIAGMAVAVFGAFLVQIEIKHKG